VNLAFITRTNIDQKTMFFLFVFFLENSWKKLFLERFWIWYCNFWTEIMLY